MFNNLLEDILYLLEDNLYGIVGVCIGVIAFILFVSKKKRNGEDIPTQRNGHGIRYHYFIWFIILPLLIGNGIDEIIYSFDFAPLISLVSLVSYTVLFCASFIGFFKFARYSWICIVSGIVFYILYRVIWDVILLYWLESPDFSLYVIMAAFMISEILTLIYYLKRKTVFDGE